MRTKEQKAAIAVTIILITLMGANAIAVSVIQWQSTITNSSGVKTSSPLITYSGDTTKSSELTSIDWGFLYPDSYKTYVFSVYNDHPQNDMELYFIVDNWSPKEAQDYIKLECTFQEDNLSPKNITRVTIRLTVSEDVKNVTEFSFDIIITGIQKPPT